MLPADDMVLPADFLTAALHPSLRAATSLERRYGGFERLFVGVRDGNLGVMADIIAAGASLSKGQVLELFDRQPLGVFLPNIAALLAKFLYVLAGIDPAGSATASAQQQGERMTFAEYHAKLYRIATGWLGWSPDQAWNATPAEIMAAYDGRVELLQAIFGKGQADGDTNTTEPPSKAALDRTGLDFLRGIGFA